MFKIFFNNICTRAHSKPHLWLDTCGSGFNELDHALLGWIFTILEHVGNNPIMNLNIIPATLNSTVSLHNVMTL